MTGYLHVTPACMVHKGAYIAWPNSLPDNPYGLYAGHPVVTDGRAPWLEVAKTKFQEELVSLESAKALTNGARLKSPASCPTARIAQRPLGRYTGRP